MSTSVTETMNASAVLTIRLSSFKQFFGTININSKTYIRTPCMHGNVNPIILHEYYFKINVIHIISKYYILRM